MTEDPGKAVKVTPKKKRASKGQRTHVRRMKQEARKTVTPPK